MPLSYGGGIKTADDAKRIIDLGVEKISVSSAVFDDFDLLDKIANAIGAQSVSVTFDVKKICGAVMVSILIMAKNL